MRDHFIIHAHIIRLINDLIYTYNFSYCIIIYNMSTIAKFVTQILYSLLEATGNITSPWQLPVHIYENHTIIKTINIFI